LTSTPSSVDSEVSLPSPLAEWNGNVMSNRNPQNKGGTLVSGDGMRKLRIEMMELQRLFLQS
jgi:hypothetical protein